MLAALYYGPMDLRLEDCPIPQPRTGEVLVKVAAATTCGTDVKSFRRGHPLLFQNIPAAFGHEVSGSIAAVGKGVAQFSEGDDVVVANSAPCQHCFYCQRGRYSLCEHLLFLNGAYAEYLLVPEPIVRQNLYKLMPGASHIAAALTEPLACALHGIEASDIMPGDTVVILGAGPLGLLLAAVAKQRGAHIVITGRGAQRLAVAHHFGADAVIDVSGLTSEEQVESIRNETGNLRGADVVIEAVGTPETWKLAVAMARPGGLVNFFGGCPSGTQVSLETRSLHYGELTMKGVFHHTPLFFQQALELITGHHIDVEALITARVPLGSILDVFNLLLRKQGIKYALIPPASEETSVIKEAPE